jgi:hypothetical protein
MSKKINILDCQNYAKSKNGECKSQIYNYKEKITFKCSDKTHPEWSVKFSNMKKDNSWCPYCSGNRIADPLALCHQIAKERGGKFLSTEYINKHTPLKWKCGNTKCNQYEWESNIDNIKNSNHWCPKCGGTSKLSIIDCIKIATENEGKCLDLQYKNMKILMNWECKYKHKWKQNFHNIKDRKSWCPQCKLNKSEKICKEILESIWKIPFEKAKPTWLTNSSGRTLELDGYNEEHKVAFEYQGIQHYKEHKLFHQRDNSSLEKQQLHDKIKVDKCKENNINLIIIPYWYNFQDLDRLKKYLYDESVKIWIDNIEFLHYLNKKNIKYISITDKIVKFKFFDDIYEDNLDEYSSMLRILYPK